MMPHILQRDWNTSRKATDPFVDEVDINHSVIEKILCNKFWDPLISSEEEDNDEARVPIDWDSIFRKRNAQDYEHRVFVPGYRHPPPHPKLSGLTRDEHRQCLKVLCANSQSLLPKVFLGRPYHGDFKVFESKKEIYAAEQKEYLEWAKTLWVTTNCIRALRPKQPIEMIYDAEYKMKAHMMQSFPKTYTLAAQIPLRADNQPCQIILPKNDLIQVNTSSLPTLWYPDIYKGRYSVQQACALPEPCAQHPCHFKLPNESCTSLLPLTEIHKELAQYANENGADCIASEAAVRCLLERDRYWSLPVSVCQVIAPDGDKSNVVVLGNEFPTMKEAGPVRSYKAYKHLLQKAFTAKTNPWSSLTEQNDSFKNNKSFSNPNKTSTDMPSNSQNTRGSEEQSAKDTYTKPRARRNSKLAAAESLKAGVKYNSMVRKVMDQLALSDDDSDVDMPLLIDDEVSNPEKEKAEVFHFGAGGDDGKATTSTKEQSFSFSDNSYSPPQKIMKVQRTSGSGNEDNDIGLFSCVCKDSEFEVPAPRSFRNWQIKNYATKEQVNVIIHCSHKLKNKAGEDVILEPILEYQLDVGGTLQSEQKQQSLQFSLMLRNNADLINVRLDGLCGEVVTIDTVKLPELIAQHGDFAPQTANTIYTALNQAAGLVPGDYVLQHEPLHGCNALLYSSRGPAGAAPLALAWGGALPATEEARRVQKPPNLGPVLLPCHKNRRQLPLTFTFEPKYVAQAPAKPVVKAKPPPSAMQLEGGMESGSTNKWPKKKKKNKKKKKKNPTP